MLQTIKEEFLNELANSTTIGGSLYTREDVGQIIGIFAERIEVANMQQPVSTYRIDEDIINSLVDIAERWAINHAENCANNYDFDDVDYDTNDYRGELTVTASVNVDSNSLARSATFDTTGVKVALKELLTPNAQSNA
jgi:hypothetical protein